MPFANLAPVYRYVTVVSLAGSGLFVTLLGRGLDYAGQASRDFWLFAAFVVIGEFLPVTVPYRGEKEEITTSATFAFALLLNSGVVPAVMALGLASVIADGARGKPLWKVQFNLAQYTLSLAAAGGVLIWAGTGSLLGDLGAIAPRQLPAILASAGVYFLVNNTLAGTAVAMAQGVGVLRFLRGDLRFQAATAGVLLSLSPVVVVAGRHNLLLILLLILPLAAVYRGVSMTLENARNQERFRSLVQNAGDLISILDADGTIRYQSPSAGPVLGCPPERMVETRLFEWLHADDVGAVRVALAETLRGPGRAVKSEFRYRKADGGWVELEAIWSNLLEEPSVRGIVVNARDITERKALERQLAHQAFHDPLTNLANRALFKDRVEHALARRARTLEPLRVVFLDLDDFKTVNDSLGHAAGDELLVAVADRIRGVLRPADTAARMGGDEFAVLLEDVRSVPLGTVAQRIIDALGEPFSIQGKEVFVRASVGIAQPSATSESAEELLRNADVAMYMAKSDGKGRYEVFVPSMHAAALERLELGADLRRALEREEFVLSYQPIFDLKAGTVVGVEALVRWNHPLRGRTPPSAFVPLAEETGLIVPLGRWILHRACRQVREWQERYPSEPPLMASVNLSTRQLQQPEMVEEIAEALRESGLAPRSLLLEITESAMMQDVESTIEKLRAMKELGVRLAVDDFGTGYSSLSYLQRFPLDVLKIDKSFVDNIAGGPEDSALARAIVKMGRTLGLQTLAEGIEDAGQLERLKALGCHLGQGYHLSMPLTVEEAVALLGGAAHAPGHEAPGHEAPGRVAVGALAAGLASAGL